MLTFDDLTALVLVPVSDVDTCVGIFCYMKMGNQNTLVILNI